MALGCRPHDEQTEAGMAAAAPSAEVWRPPVTRRGGNSQEVPPRQIDGRDFGRVCGVLCTRLALAMEGLRWLGLEPGRKTEPFPPACFYVIN